MADEEKVWLFDAVIGFLKGPEWAVPVWDFIDSNCIVFDSDEENKLAYGDIFDNFRELVESLLMIHLEDMSVTSDEFVQLCSTHGTTDAGREVLEQILAVDDFVSFKQMMVKRNIELELESLKELQVLQEEGPPPPAEDEDEEEAQLKEVLALSLQEAKDNGDYTDVSAEEIERLLTAQEDAEMKKAIALSLVMEEQASKEQTGEQEPRIPVQTAPQEERPPAPVSAPPPVMHRTPPPVKPKLGTLAPIPRQTAHVDRPMTEAQLFAQEKAKAAQENAAKAREAEVERMQAAGSGGGAGAGAGAGGASAAEVRARAEHLKKQRDIILAKKAKEREAKLTVEQKATEPPPPSQPQAAAMRAPAGYTAPPTDANAAARAHMAVNLAAAMKSTLLGEDAATLDLQNRIESAERKMDFEATKQKLRDEGPAAF